MAVEWTEPRMVFEIPLQANDTSATFGENAGRQFLQKLERVVSYICSDFLPTQSPWKKNPNL